MFSLIALQADYTFLQKIEADYTSLQCFYCLFTASYTLLQHFVCTVTGWLHIITLSLSFWTD